MDATYTTPSAIEAESMRIIGEELARRGIALLPEHETVVKRVIHTTADFDYAEALRFTENAVERAVEALRAGASIVTDTNMARSGVSKAALAKLGGEVLCYMADPDVAAAAKAQGTTRAVVCMDKGAKEHPGGVLAVGNAPTALLRARELLTEGKLSPVLVIGAPVGFVQVVESKELWMEAPCPRIIARGRKGGSTVAAAILNALLYQAAGRQL